MEKPVVVGYDGTPASRTAARWAADRAEAEHRPLRIVHVRANPGVTTGAEQPRGSGSDQTAGCRLDPLDSDLHGRHPELPIDLMIVVGNLAAVLLREACSAHLLVLGKGTTATELAPHARCPVIVVPASASDSTDVIVGADGMPYSEAALDFAFRSAAAAASHVVAIRTPGSPAVAARQAAGHPDVEVVIRTVDSPGDALVAASAHAGLLVIGSRGGAAVHGLLSRSITHAVLRRSRCPVAVVQGGSP